MEAFNPLDYRRMSDRVSRGARRGNCVGTGSNNEAEGGTAALLNKPAPTTARKRKTSSTSSAPESTQAPKKPRKARARAKTKGMEGDADADADTDEQKTTPWKTNGEVEDFIVNEQVTTPRGRQATSTSKPVTPKAPTKGPVERLAQDQPAVPSPSEETPTTRQQNDGGDGLQDSSMLNADPAGDAFDSAPLPDTVIEQAQRQLLTPESFRGQRDHMNLQEQSAANAEKRDDASRLAICSTTSSTSCSNEVGDEASTKESSINVVDKLSTENGTEDNISRTVLHPAAGTDGSNGAVAGSTNDYEQVMVLELFGSEHDVPVDMQSTTATKQIGDEPISSRVLQVDGYDDAATAASSSGLTLLSSNIMTPAALLHTEPRANNVLSSLRPRRVLKPIERFGASAEVVSANAKLQQEVSKDNPAQGQKGPVKTPDSARDRFIVILTVNSPAHIHEEAVNATRRTGRKPRAAPRAVRRPRKSQTKALEESPITKQNVYQEPGHHVDGKLIALSLKLMKREPLSSKPQAKGEPEVWADSRQALCETVPYFKKPQGGCHQNDRHTYAFLFDNVGHCREYMDSDVIIARAGGSMESDSSTGAMIQKKDQLMSEAQVQSVLNDVQLKNPVVIICGDKNQGAVCRMPHRYNVLGWYKPVDVWAEKTRGKGAKVWATIKYRFERLGATARAAWYETGSIELTEEERHLAGPLVKRTCDQCAHEYPVVYLVSWMCLNQACPAFWKIPATGEDADYGKLHYNPAFLLHRTAWPVEEEPFSVRPPIPHVGSVIGDNLTKINTRGICCPKCGRCSSRRLFRGWRCDNPSCDFENFPKHIPVRVPMLHQPWESTGDGPALARNKHEAGAKVDVRYVHGFKVYTYTFEGIKGKFVHAASNAAINRIPRGADEMFTAVQNQDDPAMDLHLERRRFGIEKNSGGKVAASDAAASSETHIEAADAEEMGDTSKRPELDDGDFMTAFSMNYGMPYKFVASGSSMPFTGAPWPVRACRADLNWASQTFLDQANHVDLNEELMFAYMEGQKIEYHDDGESGLGPRIATLSLGGKAKMHMRMKMKHHVGCSKTGIMTAERPVPGGLGGGEMFQRRLNAWTELQAIKGTDKPRYEKRRKEVPKELGLFEQRMKKAEDLVTITLNHGDIVLMEGYEIQQYLEHKVVPEGPLRFALTCRTVLPEHLTPEELPLYEVEADDEALSGLRKMATQQDL